MKKLALGLLLINSACIIYGMQQKMIMMVPRAEMKQVFCERGLAAFYHQAKLGEYAEKRCHTGALEIVVKSRIERFNRRNACQVTPEQVRGAFYSLFPTE